MSLSDDNDLRSRRAALGAASSRSAAHGWPVMQGSPEDRDMRFRRRAIREAIRLGLVAAPPARPGRFPAAMAQIVQNAADKHHLKVAELRGPSRAVKVTQARADAMRDLHAAGRWSLKQIAWAVGLTDHTSVLHALRGGRS